MCQLIDIEIGGIGNFLRIGIGIIIFLGIDIEIGTTLDSNTTKLPLTICI